jgi:predicted DNA-binding transcriptional regulator YafY
VSSESQRSASIDRHLLLVADLLRGVAHDRHSLAKRLGVQPAMADRLIKAAVQSLPGVSEQREGRHRRIRLRLASLTPAPTYPTAVAACFGASLWPLFQGSSYQLGIRHALAHVIGTTRRQAVFKDIDRKFWFLRRGGEAGLLERAPLLDEAIEAVLHHKVVAIEYTRFDGAVERLHVEPLSIVVHDHQLYIIGRTESGSTGRRLHKQPEGAPTFHPYRFSRIVSVDVLDRAFRYPSRSEYDPERIFRDSFGVFLGRPVANVELRLHARWSTYARTHRWHDSQVVRVRRDHVQLELRVGLCPELEAWILGFGDQAEVVAPKELRDRVGARHARAAETYARSRPHFREGRPMSRSLGKGIKAPWRPRAP